MKKKHLLVLALAFSFVGLTTYSGVKAQEEGGNGFRISPVRAELTINPGESDTVEVTAINPSSSSVNARVIVNDFEAAYDETGQPRVIFDTDAAAPANSFRSLVGDLGTVDIEGDGEVKIPVIINVPADAAPGGYYGAVRLEPTSETDKNVNLAASVGTLFLVTVPGDLNEQIELVEISAAKSDSTGRFFIGGGEDIQVVTRLLNTGNIHTKPFGTIQIADNSGNVVEQFEFNDLDPRSNVLPDSTRKFVDDLEYSDFFGKYTITANLGYGNGGSLITATNTFWVIPVWVAVAAVLAIIATIIGAFLVYRKLNKTRKHKVKPRR